MSTGGHIAHLALLLGETIHWSMVAGAAVILVGTYLVSVPRRPSGLSR